MIGFIGGGNMARAIIGGVVSSGFDANKIIVSDKNKEVLQSLKTDFGVKITNDNNEVAKSSDILFLCIKPNILQDVAEEIESSVSEQTILVSIVAGKDIFILERFLGDNKKIVRVMPNTPAMVGEGMSAICCNENAKSDLDVVVDIFNKIGKSEIVSEGLMDIVTAVSGSSPAYVFMMIEAMADGAVKGGMTRELAYKFAAQAVLGSAKMVLESGIHPAELKDKVCSPGGTTIEAVAALEKYGLRNAILKAMKACEEKSKNL